MSSLNPLDNLGLGTQPPAGLPLDIGGEPPPAGPEFFRDGGIVFSEAEVEVLGDVKGQRILHLLCGNGEETLSLVNMGASVIAVDEEVEEAKAIATEAGLSAEFRPGSAFDLAADLRNGSFDTVYSGFGILVDLADLDEWAAGVAAALKAGGRLVLYDEHPLAYIVGPGDSGGEVLAITSSYFGVLGDDEVIEGEEEADDALEEDEDVTEGESQSMGWTIGDIVTALGENGLATVQMRELYSSPRFTTPLDDIEVDAQIIARVPGILLLEAVLLPG